MKVRFAIMVAATLALLSGCAGLTPGTALQTADTVARGACAVLMGASPVDTLAATKEVQKAIVEEVRKEAERNADPATVRALFVSIAQTADSLEGLSTQLVKLAGRMPDRVPAPCPALPTAPSATPTAALPPPAATAPLGAAPLSP